MADISIPEIKGFVIYNTKTQLFSSGGCYPRWKKKPKIWSDVGHLKNHLSQLIRNGYQTYYFDDVYKDAIILDMLTKKESDIKIYEYLEDFSKRRFDAPFYSNYKCLGISNYSEYNKYRNNVNLGQQS